MSKAHQYSEAELALWAQFGLTPRERFVEVGPERTRLRLTEVGAGPPMVFVGGTAGTGPYWAPLIAQLPDVRAIVVDRPGFGLSDPIDYRQRPYGAVVAEVLEDVLDRAEIAEAAMVGSSIGDVWALTAAERLAGRITSVVLLGGGPLTEDITPPPFIRLLRSPVGALIVRVPQRPRVLRGRLREMGHRASVDDDRIPDEFFEWQSALMRSTPSMRHERRMVQDVLGRAGFVADLRFDASRRLAIKQPVLMVVGSEDPVGSVDIWSRFTGDLPDGTLRVLADGGHLPWWDDPVVVGRWVREHLPSRRAPETA